MTNTSGEINSQSKQDITDRHVAKGKSAPSAHYLAHVMPFIAYVIFSLNPTLRQSPKNLFHTQERKKIITQTSTFTFLVCKEAVLVDSLMTDQSAAQQLTTTTHELFTPCTADCTIKRKCCEIFDDVMLLIWSLFYERYEHVDTKAVNNSFLSSKSRLNLIGMFS